MKIKVRRVIKPKVKGIQMIVFDMQILFIIVLPLWLIYKIISYIMKAKKKKVLDLKKELLINGFFIYCLTVVGITFFPLFIGNDGLPGSFISINYIPVLRTLNELKEIQSSSISNFMLKFWIRNIGGNLVLLMPLGILLPILWNKFRGLKVMIITGLSISFMIEALQLLSVLIGNRGRAFDVDDLILNTIGAGIGYGLYYLYLIVLRKHMKVQALYKEV